MLFKILPLAALFIGLQAFAAPDIFVGSANGDIRVKVTMDRDHVLTQRTVEALVQSADVEEVSNIYLEPKTFYKGQGFTLKLGNTKAGSKFAVITLRFTPQDATAFVVQGTFFRATATSGAIRNFHKALLASKSRHVITKDNPGILGPGAGDAYVLETDSFGGANIACREAFRRPEETTCSFSL